MAWSFRIEGGCLVARGSDTGARYIVELAPLMGAQFACLVDGFRVELVDQTWRVACPCVNNLDCPHLTCAIEARWLWEALASQAQRADSEDLAASSVPAMLAERSL